MIITSISDVHIKESSDKNFELLQKFFSHDCVKNSQYIILNGDIFDILIGGKIQYLKKYDAFFHLIKKAVENDSIVVYIEGNHDFHIERLIRKSVKKLKIDEDKFIHVKSHFDIDLSGKKVRFTHGDDVEIENKRYQQYKKKINNKFVKFLGDYIVPFKLIEWVGHNASNKSRESNVNRYELSAEGQEFIKDKFRRSSEDYFSRHTIDALVCGHSHCKDFYSLDNGRYYINNGFAPASKSFIKITEDGAEFVDL